MSKTWRKLMTTRRLAAIAAAVDVSAGFALIVSPALFVQLLLRANLTDEGIAVGRVGGFGLLSLGMACWPASDILNPHSVSALFTYNILGALYIGYLGISRESVGLLLWPAFVLHASLASLLAHPAYGAVRRERLASHLPKVG